MGGGCADVRERTFDEGKGFARACRLRFQDRTVSSLLDLVCRPLFTRQAILLLCYQRMCGDRQAFYQLCCRYLSETRSIEHFSLLAWAQKSEGGQCIACPTRAQRESR